jgi:4-alpha-glucanotransferase
MAQFANFHLNERTDFDKEFYPAMMEALFRSNAWIAVVMITDLLGQTERFNVPGTAAETNWTRRMRMSAARLRSSRSVRDRMRVIKRSLEATGRAAA